MNAGDLKKFITNQLLEHFDIEFWEEMITISVYLDSDHKESVKVPDEDYFEEIEYSFESKGVRVGHLKWHRGDDGELEHTTDHISVEDALILRGLKKPKKSEDIAPRARMYTIVINGRIYPLSCAQDIFEELKRRFLPWCSKLGKGSVYKEQIKFEEMRTYYKIRMFMTKRNFMQVLDQIDYEVSPGGGKTYYIFKGFKEENK